MKVDFKTIVVGVIAGYLMVTAQAGDLKNGYYLAQTDASFEDAISDLKDAVVNRGLVIDFTGHVGKMLSRTSDATAMKSPYAHAKYMQFCSAKHTHAAVAASVENMAICPYVVFAYARQTEPTGVTIGYRRPIGAPGAASELAVTSIEKLLRSIVDEASGQ